MVSQQLSDAGVVAGEGQQEDTQQIHPARAGKQQGGLAAHPSQLPEQAHSPGCRQQGVQLDQLRHVVPAYAQGSGMAPCRNILRHVSGIASMASPLKAQHGRRACRKEGSVTSRKLSYWSAQQRQDCAWQFLRQDSGSPATQGPHELQRHAEAARYARSARGQAAVPV